MTDKTPGPGQQQDQRIDALEAKLAELHAQYAALDKRVSEMQAPPSNEHPEQPPNDDVVTPPDVPGKLPVRVARGPIEHKSAENFVVDRPTRVKNDKTVSAAGAWLDKYPRPAEPVEYRLVNGVIRNYGPIGGSRWDHGIYANNADLFLDDIHIHAPTHREALGRSHPIYLNGSSLTASRLMIGHPDDEHPHTISINIDKGDDVEHKPRPVTIDTLLVYGGWRNVIENTPGTVSKLTIGKMIVVNPVTADGLWEGIEVEGCGVDIGDYAVIDTAGRWKDGLAFKGKNTTGGIAMLRVHADALWSGLPLATGVTYSRERIPLPATPMPTWSLDNFDALVAWAGAA